MYVCSKHLHTIILFFWEKEACVNMNISSIVISKLKIFIQLLIYKRMDILSQQLAGHIPDILSIRTKLSDPFPT